MGGTLPLDEGGVVVADGIPGAVTGATTGVDAKALGDLDSGDVELVPDLRAEFLVRLEPRAPVFDLVFVLSRFFFVRRGTFTLFGALHAAEDISVSS